MTRQDLRARGEGTLRTLFGDTAQTKGFANLLTEAAYGGIWTRGALDIPDRLVCAIAALATGPRLKSLRRYLKAGLDHGLTTEAIREILVQASLYAGFSAAEETLELAAEVFSARGLSFPPDPPEDVPLEELDRRGAALMARLHGARATHGYAAPDNKVTGALYPSAIRYGYGEIWFRPGLDHRRRALVAVAGFTALRLPEQVAKFGQSALNMGLTTAQVIEAIIQTAPLTGFPPALNALGAIAPHFGRGP
ncbi:carboxymuconolactone decarboxylase family protein [Rhodopila sp.]|jgi:alkylhydroperoxidase/carboxymuconolactone decarboxylase family protein YurZ|uniref:carboxymuconolactone decarboxylase family protein n=1 Tax=Rhodopila sp. TaxID=2480087 RepID=UPI002BA8A7A9|nr:carboxymuconolactone decarboxylase family protein [Rhodopila sp.]HVZ08251.1 carboxymuconolactone decarboxylase family protein [Rhodopila sp.]